MFTTGTCNQKNKIDWLLISLKKKENQSFAPQECVFAWDFPTLCQDWQYFFIYLYTRQRAQCFYYEDRGLRFSRQNLKSCLLESNLSFIEFVCNKSSVSLLIKPFSMLSGWHEEQCVYWNISVALKCVWTLNILFNVKCGPLKTLIPKKTSCSHNISHVNLIVAWNLSAKSTKLLISRLP